MISGQYFPDFIEIFEEVVTTNLSEIELPKIIDEMDHFSNVILSNCIFRPTMTM